MSLTGVPPVSLLLSLPLLLCEEEKEEATTTGKMPVRLMGKMPMLRLMVRRAE
jgi:hypothetical protein